MDKEVVMEKVEEKKRSSADLYIRFSVRRMLRLVLFLIMIVVFGAAIANSLLPHEDSVADGCMGVSVLSEEAFSDCTIVAGESYDDYLRFQGELVAEDKSIIYIPQKIHDDTSMQDLNGLLTLDLPGKKLFFAPDAAWDNLKEAVSSGHKFKLLISESQDTYTQYDVVFTTLPVFAIYGDAVYTNKDEENVYTGRLFMWEPGAQSVKSSRLTWHSRGGSSLYEPKQSWRISLKDWDGSKNNEEFLSLGSDDDWILNAMNMEDTNLRDKVSMDLWNNMAAESGYSYPMSQGEYVEVLINGDYKGLFLLQRRVDDKYLDLDTDEIFVKVKPIGGVLNYTYYSVLGNPVPDQDIKTYFEEMYMPNVEPNNFVDVSLYLQLFSAIDNRIQKNMFYIFKEAEEGYTVSLIPWDMDLTMGATWSDELNRCIYDYEYSMSKNIVRMEYASMLQRYPNLDHMMCERWKQLRQTYFSQDYLEQLMNQNLDLLNSSGSVSRDQDAWGFYFGGEDTVENLYRFLDERLALLDEFYQ